MRQAPFILCIFCALFTADGVSERTLPISPELKDLAGAWIGFDAEAVAFYRLVMQEGPASFGYSVPGHPVRMYKVHSRSLLYSKLDLQMTNVNVAAEIINLEGRASSYRLDLTIVGSSGGWAQKISFFREEAIVARIKELEETMKRYSLGKGGNRGSGL